MHFDLLAYAGPDQIMTVTSGLASILGVLLIFWHKVTAFCGRILNHLLGTPAAAATEEKQIPPSS
jgi:hypothetical protein